LTEKTKIMGIINITPDSFYDGGKYNNSDDAVNRAIEMERSGASIIDIGGESTRPGSKPVPIEEEIQRVIPVIKKLSGILKIPISVDTTKSEVAEEALKNGAEIINDISGMTFDKKMQTVAAKYGATVLIMHIKGTPETMQDNPVYEDIVEEVIDFFLERIDEANRSGISNEKIILDPGIGFGKTMEDNYLLLGNLHRLKEIGFPVCVGLSRKSLIGKLYNDAEDRLPATIALNAAAVLSGADIIRVHDVKEHFLAMRGIDMLRRVS
jgi:dihydropteroate synthase